jgi:hypothetical protein
MAFPPTNRGLWRSTVTSGLGTLAMSIARWPPGAALAWCRMRS